ncbi:MAG: UDP-N-acetylmuramoyl-L-alanine--D-glutamate ligase, partial [Cyclobacteriaceae bacterium]|nr:UDP-N-acetylmuramoyl-L-alanine--D-glutamate ligase [Cyclobacteriaceae bacterium]
ESGRGAALLAMEKGFDVFVSDRGKIATDTEKSFIQWGIPYESGMHTESKILKADEIVKSPGIPVTAPVIQKAILAGIPVIDELEFAFRYISSPVIAITGTNGKTTTTLLTTHLLDACNLSPVSAGNVGKSLAAAVVENSEKKYVVEVSSFQIDGMINFKPSIAILLNITPDHLDRYSNFQQYVDSKIRLFQKMKRPDSIIVFRDDQTIMDNIGAAKTSGPDIYEISLVQEVKLGAWMEGNRLHFRLKEKQAYSLGIEDIGLKGKHNMVNVMASVLATLLSGGDWDKVRGGVSTFESVPHRMEYVGKVRGIGFVNDSKATNVEATKYALDSFSEPLVWIAGGIDKGNDYSLIRELVQQKVNAMVCLGMENKKLINAFKADVADLCEVDSMEKAVKSALKYARENDVVLLSPACASFDLFKNYEDRGNQFRREVVQHMEFEKNNKVV